MAGKAAAKGTSKTEETKTEETKSEETKAEESKSEETPPEEKKPAKQEKTYSKSEMQAEIQKAVATEKKKWDDQKDLDELERVKLENEELRSANRLRDAKDEVVTALAAAGNKSPELAWAAMKGDLVFDDKGKLTNAKDLIEGLKGSYPEQFGTEKPAGSIDGGAGKEAKGTSLTKEQVEKMTPAEINANWEEVSKVLAAN